MLLKFERKAASSIMNLAAFLAFLLCIVGDVSHVAANDFR